MAAGKNTSSQPAVGFSCSGCGGEEDAEAGVEAPTDELVGEEEAPPAETEWEREREREREVCAQCYEYVKVFTCVFTSSDQVWGGLNR